MKKILALILCVAMLAGTAFLFSGCKGDEKPDAFVIMSEELDGLFNPFFSTTGADSTIVSMTQIGMLTSKYVNGEVVEAFGEDEAVVTKDYEKTYDSAKNETTYTFVIKNGIKYSDGHPLTIEDVLFNLYVYLDPVYTGSATIYSTDIKGLTAYRTQTVGATNDGKIDEQISGQANSRAKARNNELINLFNTLRKKDPLNPADYETMKAAILEHTLSSGYKSAISANASEVTVQQLLADYDNALKLFREELESDYTSSKSSYVDKPYDTHDEFKDEIFCFMFTEGFVEVEYYFDEDAKKYDKSKIVELTPLYNKNITTKEAAIDFVFDTKIGTELNIVLQYWATAQEILTDYAAKATEVILSEKKTNDGSLRVDHIEGIVSLGHTDKAGSTIKVNGTDYKVATAHNEDGTPTAANEYDVLQITVEGVDPKAVWNFAFGVAPQHYYGLGSSVGVDIKNNKFGVEYGSFSFMTDIVQSPINIKVPVGAGAYKATNRTNEDNPAGNAFYSDNVVYFKANNYFETVGTGINNAKIEKVRYQVVSSNNALNALESGAVHYVTPQLTPKNSAKIDELEGKGMASLLSLQLGYGYIGINAGKVDDLNIRKAIMAAMNTAQAVEYYRSGTAEQIFWPMSQVSWAYPKDDSGKYSTDNGKDYIPTVWNETDAIASIREYMAAAGVSAGDDKLDITFTIAGSSLQDHPTYAVFRDAAALLNSLGWEVDVVPDTQALTKLSTGSLEVWAAAWGSTIDPDLYQVYHKNSTATSTLAWGYPSIKNESGRREEQALLNELSKLIDEARATDVQADRIRIYEEAMGIILDLAIELPVYQRSTVYVFNAEVINENSLPSEQEMNPYSSPLDRIWEIEFAE